MKGAYMTKKVPEYKTPFRLDQYVWWNTQDTNGKSLRLWGRVAVARLKQCWVWFPVGGGYMVAWCPVSELESVVVLR